MITTAKSDRKPGRLVLWLLAGTIVALSGCQPDNSVDEETIKLHKQLAGELRDNGLYEAAIEEYRSLLAVDGLTGTQRGNINYLIARVYFEDLKDYENAAAYYLRARTFDPDGSFMSEASQNLVASLQKLGNIIDAKRELDAATDVDYQPESADDRPVARIDGKPIYRSAVEREIESLPTQLQKQLLSTEAKIEYVRQYVGAELLYRAAVRENYPDDPEIVRRRENLVKRLVIEQYIVDRVMPNVTVDTSDVRNFYLAHKSDRFQDNPYDSVRAQVFFEYQQEKATAAYTDYINDLAKAENVEFLDQNW